MKRNKNSSNQFFYILLITILCVLFSFALVWPMWKFATSFSSAYTIICLLIIFAGLLFLIIRKIIHTPLRKAICFFIYFLTVSLGLFLSIFFLLAGKRFAALIVLIITTIIFILLKIINKKLFK